LISIPLTPAHLRGAQEVESTPRGLRPHRLPAWVRTRFPDPQLMLMEAQPSGIRVVGKTSAGHLELVTHPTRLAYRGVDRPRGRVDLTSNGILIGSDVLSGGDVTEVDPQTGAATFRSGVAHVSVFADLPEGDKLIELWLPHNESVELVELRADAPVAAVAPAGPSGFTTAAPSARARTRALRQGPGRQSRRAQAEPRSTTSASVEARLLILSSPG
jgi:hypothetical protein